MSAQLAEPITQAVNINAPIAIVTPRIGEVWPNQGGVYAGIMRGEAGRPDYHLIVTIGSQFEVSGQWGTYGKKINADSRTNGAGNTTVMAAAGYAIAQQVMAMECDGHRDLYIGSQAEMQIACANCPELFNQDDWYWTSTQLSANYAFAQHFRNGHSYWDGKDYEFRVRAFRAIHFNA